MKRMGWLGLLALVAGSGCDLTYRGCTDPEASNFDATADTDDGSCTFEGSAVFWYGASVAVDLDAYLSDTLTFYLDGEEGLVAATDTYWLVAPDCGVPSTYTLTVPLPNGDARVATYQVVDNFGDVLWDGVVAFNVGGCTAIKLD